MTEITITSLMKEHHMVIDSLFKKLKDFIAGSSELAVTSEAFDKFNRQLKNHLSIEESVIFSVAKELNEETTKVVFHLMREHQMMDKLSKKIQEGLINNSHSEISEMENLLVDHVSTEENILYPKLDKDLPNEKKEYMEKRIQKISGELLPN